VSAEDAAAINAEAVPREQIPLVLGMLLARLVTPAPNSPPDAERLLTIEEVAEQLNMAPSYLYELGRKNDLPTIRISPKHVRVRPQDLAQWIEGRQSKGKLAAAPARRTA
jgi:excisionase family DNA binding protein